MRHSTQVNTPTRARRRDWRPLFIEALRKSGVVGYAATAADVDRSTAYKEREKNPAFAEAWREALEDAVDDLEAEARRRAFEGVEKPVYQGGKHVGNTREYSDALMIFLLKANRPEKFTDRLRQDVNTTVQKNNVLVLDESTLKKLQERRKMALQHNAQSQWSLPTVVEQMPAIPE